VDYPDNAALKATVTDNVEEKQIVIAARKLELLCFRKTASVRRADTGVE